MRLREGKGEEGMCVLCVCVRANLCGDSRTLTPQIVDAEHSILIFLTPAQYAI